MCFSHGLILHSSGVLSYTVSIWTVWVLTKILKYPLLSICGVLVPVDEVPFGAYLSNEDLYVWAIGGALDCFSIVEVDVGKPSPEYHSPPTHSSLRQRHFRPRCRLLPWHSLGGAGYMLFVRCVKYSRPWYTIVCHDQLEGLPPKISFL